MMALRDKLGWGLAMAVSLALIASLAGVVWGGPLDPTAPPGSTGKNVITSLPFTISQSGSYVLNGNLTGVSGQNGITVNAANVTIDLQGFELVGVTGAQSGINGTQQGLTVLNGTIRNWPSYGVTTGGIGVGGVADHLNVISNGSGIFFSAKAAVSNCRVESSTSANGVGIQVGAFSRIINCVSVGNAGVGIAAVGNDTNITQVVATSNGGTEILGSARATLDDCVADGGGTAGNGIDVGDSSVVRGCTASNNGGVEIYGGPGVVLDDCAADGAGSSGNGIEVGVHSAIHGCRASNNGGDEIKAGDGSLIENCVADGYTGTAAGPGDGISVQNDATVRGCISRYNGADGIDALGLHSRLESNEVTNNNLSGIDVSNGGNVVIGNRSQVNLVNCNDHGGNAFIAVTGGTFASATHPWINFC